MLQWARNLLYSILVDSGFVFLMLPVIKPIMLRLMQTRTNKSNHQFIDEGGAKINVTKIGEKYFPPVREEKISRIREFRIRDDDVLLCGYPKTGCHWVYEIIYMLQNRNATMSKHGKEFGGMIDVMFDFILDSAPSPRVLNSHLLYEDLPEEVKTKKTKIIFTVRAAKDTVVSFYNHHLSLTNFYSYDGRFEDYYKLFMTGKLDYGCYFDYHRDWDTVMTSCPVNEIFLIKFEDLKKDPVAMIKKLAQFLDIIITDDFAQQVSDATKFSTLKKARESDEFSAKFYRKGVVGDWKNWLTPAQAKEIDRRSKDSVVDKWYTS